MQLDVFYWIRHDDPFKAAREGSHGNAAHKRISAKEVVKRHGVPLGELQNYVGSQIKEAESFGSLPFTLLFVAAHACMIVLHDNAVNIRAVEESIAFDIFDNANFAWDNDNMGHKNMNSVNSFADFWSWANLGLLPLLFIQETAFAEGRNMSDPMMQNASRLFGLDERGVLLEYNRIVGGVRFRQERSDGHACESTGQLLNFYNQSCVGPAYETEPELWEGRFMNHPTRKSWFYVREDYSVLKDRLREMEASRWLDRGTKKIEISIPVYTAEFGLHTLVMCNFYFSRGGHIWKQIIPQSTYAEWYTHQYYAIFDSVWVICFALVFRTEFLESQRTVRVKGLRAWWTESCGFWNVVDWVSIIGGVVIVILAIISVGVTSRCNADTIKLADTSFEQAPEDYKDRCNVYIHSLQSVVQYVHIFKLVLSAYPLIIVLRLFKAFAAQPRLAVVTNTLLATSTDLAHLMLVFASIFITLAISGLVLFGRRLESFTTAPRAIMTVFRLMVGDFDWEALRSVGQTEAAIWLFVALGLLNLLLLNMVLAIVMHGYREVKRSSTQTDTLLDELVQAAYRRKGVFSGTLLELQVIDRALVMFDKEYRQTRKSTETMVKLAAAGLQWTPKDVDGEGADICLGRDTRAIVGMRAEHVDPDIAHHVGGGTVAQVGHLRCRVLHDLGETREYNIGHDLVYELKYVKGGELPEKLSEDMNELHNYQVLSPERFMKIVQSQIGRRMSLDQAEYLCTEAVNFYYKAHWEDVDLGGIRHGLRQVWTRIKKIEHVFQDGGGGQALSLNSAEETRVLREHLAEFYGTVDEDRRRLRSEILSVEQDIVEMRTRLLRVQPSASQDPELKRAWELARPELKKGEIALAGEEFDRGTGGGTSFNGMALSSIAPTRGPSGFLDTDVDEYGKRRGRGGDDAELDSEIEDDDLIAELDALLEESALVRSRGARHRSKDDRARPGHQRIPANATDSYWRSSASVSAISSVSADDASTYGGELLQRRLEAERHRSRDASRERQRSRERSSSLKRSTWAAATEESRWL